MKTLGPLIAAADLRIARAPPKTADAYYGTPEWRALRIACLTRDGFRCVVVGCSKPAIVADHIVSRKARGSDSLDNLRSLCRLHDGRFREDHTGVRRADAP